MIDLGERFANRAGLVKICGLREPEHAAAAAAAGADLVGFIFASARRQVSAEEAKVCVNAARKAAGNRDVLAVGVFVDAPIAKVNETAHRAGVDLVQLHGSETSSFIEALDFPALKVFLPKPSEQPECIAEQIDSYLHAARPPAAIVVDGFSERGSGGQGVQVDWESAAVLANSRPLMLAGGLNPENVARAIAIVRPIGVDVSSGVERAGVKDPERIHAFIAAARSAFAEINRDRSP